jgi:hypothetical protein
MKGRTMRLKALVSSIAAMALVCGSSPAGALGYVNNRAEWLGLTQEARIGYVQALNDSLNYTFVDDTLVDALAKKGRTDCLVAHNMTAATLVSYISATYRDDRYANFAPSAIYIILMGEYCRDYINRARQDFGLGPQ